MNTAVMVTTLDFIKISPKSVIAPSQPGQATAESNPKGGLKATIHTPPQKLYSKIHFNKFFTF
ncbi:MAG: hypothetical protein EWV76_21690 [Microcystis novacekii Mn_MB_F_20050700_S1]|uniref:Uncharacterized protein n=1 Tax=Microcystis novacekii Mn_MB_F_20050700_S1D TaxID=2486266 RepID=A0A552IVK1_9CHRO|nr:MAG: hypothetical protein EWV76_21690 [Microcystis novacekii Mn_MB_F_20050700_S1]TRU87510.1 MAG: hypothetical protein EWV54_12420 [Microcystis novacekii Mn_MB_F_20050700_S1D]